MADSTPSGSSDIETVERLIPAPAKAIFDLLADPSRHREIDGSGTVRDADEGSQRLALGSTFGMGMKMGLPYTMVSTVVEFDEDRLIAWQTRPSVKLMGLFIGGRIWRYQLDAQEGGTLVRESWDISQEKHKSAVRPMRTKTVEAMTATLERIERVVTPAK